VAFRSSDFLFEDYALEVRVVYAWQNTNRGLSGVRREHFRRRVSIKSIINQLLKLNCVYESM
jgi:hypothetical protein